MRSEEEIRTRRDELRTFYADVSERYRWPNTVRAIKELEWVLNDKGEK